MPINEKYPDSPRNTDIESLCLNPNFWDLKFQNSVSILEKMKNDLVELEDLDYRAHLTNQEISQIDNAKSNLNSYLQQIRDFTLTQWDPSGTKNNIENNIRSFYDNNFAQQTRSSLIYLRQEIKSNSKTEKELQKTLIEASRIKDQLQDQFETIRNDKESIQKESGINSSKHLSQEFEKQSDMSDIASTKWFKFSLGFYALIVIWVIIWFAWYFFNIKPQNDKYLTTEWWIFVVIITSIIFYGLSFCSMNFNIHKNLYSINRHRRNVAESFIWFLENINTSEEKEVFLRDVSRSLFEHQSTGYLDKDQMQISTPVQEMVTKIVSSKI